MNKKESILIVDDDIGICTTLKNILLKKGYDVGVAHTGEEAIAKSKENVYHILLIDMKLPTINGLETYSAIKEINPEAVAIIMTAYRHEIADFVKKAALNHIIYTFFYKPLDIENLLKLINDIREREQKE